MEAASKDDPNHVQPIAAPFLRMTVGHDLDQAVVIRIASEHVVQNPLAGGFVGPQPLQIAGEIELFRDVDHPVGLGIEKIAPLGLVEAVGVIGARHGIPRAVSPTGFHPAVGTDGMVALIVERRAVVAGVGGVVDQQAQLGEPLFLQDRHTRCTSRCCR